MGNTKAHQEWVAANTTRIVMNLNHNTDKDVLEKLSQVPSKQGYIKELIRADLREESRSDSFSAKAATGGPTAKDK